MSAIISYANYTTSGDTAEVGLEATATGEIEMAMVSCAYNSVELPRDPAALRALAEQMLRFVSEVESATAAVAEAKAAEETTYRQWENSY